MQSENSGALSEINQQEIDNKGKNDIHGSYYLTFLLWYRERYQSRSEKNYWSFGSTR